MMRRLRFLAGLTATVALSLSIAGGIALSASAAEIEFAGVGDTHEAIAGHAGGTALDDCTEAHGSEAAPTPWCPMAPGAGQICSPAALLARCTVTAIAGTPSATEEYLPEAREPHLLLATVHYHPPKF